MLNEKQQKCIILMVTTNKTQEQIAKEIQVNKNTICEWKKDEEFKNELQNQMKNNFSSLAIDAQKELKKLLKSKNEYVRLQVVKDILDRAGYKATDKIEHSGNIESPHLNLLESINRQLGGGNSGNNGKE